MLLYVLVFLVILLLVILFRYLPRRIFFIFIALLTVLGGIVFQMQTAERVPEQLSVEQHSAIARDQELFTPYISEANCRTGPQLDALSSNSHRCEGR